MSDVPPPPSSSPPSSGSEEPPQGVVPLPPPMIEGVPFVIPTPIAAPPRRPSVLTTAAIVLMVQAILHGLGGALVLSISSSPATSQLIPAGTIRFSATAGVLLLVLAALELIAGFLVLRLRGAGRVLGLGLAGVELILGIVALIDGQGTAVVAIGIDLFLFYALATTGDVFARARQR